MFWDLRSGRTKHTCTRPRGSQTPTIFWGTRRGDGLKAWSHMAVSLLLGSRRPPSTQLFSTIEIWQEMVRLQPIKLKPSLPW